MKITFCCYDKPGNVGGPFFWLRHLLPRLRDHGLECECLFLTHFGGTGPVLEALRSDGFCCHAVDCHPRMADQVRWILEHVSRSQPDIFVPNLVVAAYHAVRWIKPAGIPCIGILHSDDPYYRAIQDEFVFGKSANRVSDIVCVSRQLEHEVNSRKPSHVSVHRIPYGVTIPPTPTEHNPNRFRIAYVGRLAEEQKQISKLTRALIRVCRRLPDAEAVIYGDGPDRSNVESILNSDGQDVNVVLAGAIPNEEIQDKLCHVDVLALLSDYEGLPIALLEAMACGCVPVCLEMRSGIPELIRHEQDGLIVADRETDFEQAIIRLYQDRDLLQSLSDAARRRVRTDYARDTSITQWVNLVNSTNSTARRPVRVPRRISLPARNAALESPSHREPPLSTLMQVARRVRMLAGRVRRRVL